MITRLLSKLTGLVFYIAALLAGIVITFVWLRSVFAVPVDPASTNPVPFLIERNWSIQTVAKTLETQKLVKHWWAIYFLARLKRDKLPNVKPGEYSLSYSLTPAEILQKFINQEIMFHDLVVPEGSTVKDVGIALAKTTLVTPEEAVSVFRDRVLMQELEIPADSFEGYLFPARYKFSRPDDAKYMLTTLVKEGKRKLTKEMFSRAIELGLSMHQVLTLASIIEKETGVPGERKLVSSVLHNRLKLGWPLQADPTVIYGIRNFNGNLTKEHLATPGPYNTYLNTGLPPTPICNPGLDSIMAALYPEETDYLFFVAKGDGTSVYSSTYKEHREAVKKYQVDRREDLLKDVLAE